MSILGTVGAGLDLNFLNELEWQVSARAAERGVGRRYAVENVVVLRTRGTADRRIAVTTRSVTKTRTSNARCNRVKRLDGALSREVRELFARKVVPFIAGVFDADPLSGYGNRTADAASCSLMSAVALGRADHRRSY